MSLRAPQGAVDINQRYKALLAITESISSHANLKLLFKELPKQLRPVVDFDAVAVLLYEPATAAMRLHVFETINQLPVEPRTGNLIEVDQSAEGLSWKTQQPILISPVSAETRFPAYIRRLRADEIETLYCIPLTSSHRRLGAIAFGSRRADAYAEPDLEFLRQVAKQAAVQN